MVHVSSEYRHRLPTVEELPCSDETPVDNELQNYIPSLLLNLLIDIWGDPLSENVSRPTDWFFGVDMAVYYAPNLEDPKKSKSVVPDGFLALGVKERPNEGGRLSYAIWEEGVTPILFLEVISKEYNNEYEDKLEKYEELGILYYVVYNSLLTTKKIFRNHQALEVYKLIDGKYQLQPSIALLPEGGEMVWMPEIGLGIGCEQGDRGDWKRAWVYWYDRFGTRYPTARERALREYQEKLQERFAKEQAMAIAAQEKLAKQQAEVIAERERKIAEQANLIADRANLEKQQAEQKAQRLAERLRALGINPDEM
jgi:Uma2 family endonuclease